MSVSYTHKETGRFLTLIDKDALPGSEHMISIGHPLLGGEFTTYRLGQIVAHDEFWHGPLYDLAEAEVKVGNQFYPPKMLAEIRNDYSQRTVVLGGLTLTRNVFGHFSLSREAA